jgi:hypothetical protein
MSLSSSFSAEEQRYALALATVVSAVEQFAEDLTQLEREYDQLREQVAILASTIKDDAVWDRMGEASRIASGFAEKLDYEVAIDTLLTLLADLRTLPTSPKSDKPSEVKPKDPVPEPKKPAENPDERRYRALKAQVDPLVALLEKLMDEMLAGAIAERLSGAESLAREGDFRGAADQLLKVRDRLNSDDQLLKRKFDDMLPGLEKSCAELIGDKHVPPELKSTLDFLLREFGYAGGEGNHYGAINKSLPGLLDAIRQGQAAARESAKKSAKTGESPKDAKAPKVDEDAAKKPSGETPSKEDLELEQKRKEDEERRKQAEAEQKQPKKPAENPDERSYRTLKTQVEPLVALLEKLMDENLADATAERLSRAESLAGEGDFRGAADQLRKVRDQLNSDDLLLKRKFDDMLPGLEESCAELIGDEHVPPDLKSRLGSFLRDFASSGDEGKYYGAINKSLPGLLDAIRQGQAAGREGAKKSAKTGESPKDAKAPEIDKDAAKRPSEETPPKDEMESEKKRKEDEEHPRQAEAKQKQEQDERLKQEAAEQKKREEEDERRKTEERRRQEEVKQEEERVRLEAEQARRNDEIKKQEEERRQQDEAKRKQEEERLRLEAEEARRNDEIKKQEEERRQQDEAKRKQEEERLRLEAEELKRQEDAKKPTEEELRQQEEAKKKQEEIERLKRDAEEQKRKEEELKRLKEEELKKREEEERLQREGEERIRNEQKRKAAQQKLDDTELAVTNAESSVDARIRANVLKMLRADPKYIEYLAARKKVETEPLEPAHLQTLQGALDDALLNLPALVAEGYAALWKADGEAAQQAIEAAVKLASGEIRVNLIEALKTEPLRAPFSEHRKQKVAGNYDALKAELDLKRNAIIVRIGELRLAEEALMSRVVALGVDYGALSQAGALTEPEVKAYESFLAAKPKTPSAIAAIESTIAAAKLRRVRATALRLALDTLIADLKAQLVEVALFKDAENIQQMLTEIDDGLNTAEVNATNLEKWEKSLVRRRETFDANKVSLAAAQATVARAVTYLRKECKLIGRGNTYPSSVPTKAKLEEHLGKVAKWSFSFEDLKAEIAESFKDGVMLISVINNPPFSGGTGGQRYLAHGNYHVSVSFKNRDTTTVEITKVHVSYEDGLAEDGRPRYWFNVADGKITNGDGASGAANRRPATFQADAKAAINAKAGKFNCRSAV